MNCCFDTKKSPYHDHNNDKWNKQVHDQFLKDKQKTINNLTETWNNIYLEGQSAWKETNHKVPNDLVLGADNALIVPKLGLLQSSEVALL